jgi:hypothetical protein
MIQSMFPGVFTLLQQLPFATHRRYAPSAPSDGIQTTINSFINAKRFEKQEKQILVYCVDAITQLSDAKAAMKHRSVGSNAGRIYIHFTYLYIEILIIILIFVEHLYHMQIWLNYINRLIMVCDYQILI